MAALGKGVMVKTMTKIGGWLADLNDFCFSYLERSGMINSRLLVECEVGQTVNLVDPQENLSLWPLNWVTCKGLFYVRLWVSVTNYKPLLFLLLSGLSHKSLGSACSSLGAVFSRLFECRVLMHIHKITSNSQKSNLLSLLQPAYSNRCWLGAWHRMWGLSLRSIAKDGSWKVSRGILFLKKGKTDERREKQLFGNKL